MRRGFPLDFIPGSPYKNAHTSGGVCVRFACLFKLSRFTEPIHAGGGYAQLFQRLEGRGLCSRRRGPDPRTDGQHECLESHVDPRRREHGHRAEQGGGARRFGEGEEICEDQLRLALRDRPGLRTGPFHDGRTRHAAHAGRLLQSVDRSRFPRGPAYDEQAGQVGRPVLRRPGAPGRDRDRGGAGIDRRHQRRRADAGSPRQQRDRPADPGGLRGRAEPGRRDGGRAVPSRVQDQPADRARSAPEPAEGQLRGPEPRDPALPG